MLQITIEREQPGLYHEESDDQQKWLRPSPLVDADNAKLMAVAEELTVAGDSANERAQRIQHFVMKHLSFKIYRDHFRFSASETYEMGYGTCVNHARLFVALSRAAGLPARTVWGITYNDGIYDWHREWAEFLDEDGYWHPLDFNDYTAFDLSDIRYLDLIYAAEENPLHEQSTRDRYSRFKRQFIVYDSSQPGYDGRLGFTLVEDNYPDSFVVENRYVLAELPRMVPQKSD